MPRISRNPGVLLWIQHGASQCADPNLRLLGRMDSHGNDLARKKRQLALGWTNFKREYDRKQMSSHDAKEKRTERQQYMQEPYFFSGKSTHCMFKIILNTFSTLADYYASMFVFVVLALHAQVVFFQMLSGRVPSEDGSVRGIFQEGADTFLHMFFCWWSWWILQTIANFYLPSESSSDFFKTRRQTLLAKTRRHELKVRRSTWERCAVLKVHSCANTPWIQ